MRVITITGFECGDCMLRDGEGAFPISPGVRIHTDEWGELPKLLTFSFEFVEDVDLPHECPRCGNDEQLWYKHDGNPTQHLLKFPG